MNYINNNNKNNNINKISQSVDQFIFDYMSSRMDIFTNILAVFWPMHPLSTIEPIWWLINNCTFEVSFETKTLKLEKYHKGQVFIKHLCDLKEWFIFYGNSITRRCYFKLSLILRDLSNRKNTNKSSDVILMSTFTGLVYYIVDITFDNSYIDETKLIVCHREYLFLRLVLESEIILIAMQ